MMSVNKMIAKTGSNTPALDLYKISQGTSLRTLLQGMLFTCLLSALPVQAQVGAIYVPQDGATSTATAAPVPAGSPVTYKDPNQDLNVKVWGGNVVIGRDFYDDDFYPNIDWLPLSITYDSFDSSIKTITRGRTEYKKIAPGVYQDQTYNTLRQTDTGFRWNNRSNRWIAYNPAGEIKAFGNRNGTVATFKYTGGKLASTSTTTSTVGDATIGLVTTDPNASEGRISGIYDHFDQQILWFEYDASNTLVSIRDMTNRKVTYQRTRTSTTVTFNVIDPKGNNWSYQVTGILTNTFTGSTSVSLSSSSGGSGGGGNIATGSTSVSIAPVSIHVVPTTINNAMLGTSLFITDPEARVSSRRWYKNGSLAITTHADGSQDLVIVDYDDAKKTFYSREVAPGGKVTETWSDLKQDLNRGEYLRRDINGVTVSKQSVDTGTRTTTTTDARGLDTAVTKDQWDNITKTVYPDGSSVSTQYDATYSNVTRHTDENGVITQYSYDAKGNLTKMVEALGLAEQRTTDYTNDADGQRTSMTRKGDANSADATTQYEYDNSGNVIKVTDAEGGITRYTYDVMGNAITKTDPRGKLWKRTFDALGNILTATDPLNRITTIAYDKTDRPISLTDPAGNVSSLGFDVAGKLLSVTDPYGAKTSLTYDAANNPIILTDAENHTQKYDYDLDGHFIKHTDGNNNVTQRFYGDQVSGLNRLLSKIIYPTLSQEFNYDQRDRITQSTNAATNSAQALDGSSSQTTKVQYDAAGNPTVITDPANRNNDTLYNAFSQVTQISDPTGGTTQYGYDVRGNLTSVTDAKGNTHRFEYNKLNRMVKEIRPLGQTIVYSYDANSNLIQINDAKGQVKQYAYDDVNRRTQENGYLNAVAFASNNSIKSINYTYNTLGRLTGYTDGNTTATYSYDARQLKQTARRISYGTFSLAISATLNSLGQKTDIIYPDGAQYSYTYDANNQLSTVNFPSGFGSITFNSYNWTVPSQITLPGGSVRNQSYDGLLRLKDLSVKDPGQSSVMSYQYNYDLSSNITSKITEKGKTNYSYDTLDHLISADYSGTGQSNETYTYDGIANRLTDTKTAAATWVYDANNQLTSAGSLSYTYDANGNTTNQTDSSNAANTRNYIYDTDNRLIEVRNASNALIAAYSYDPFGRRLSKDAGTSKTYYFYGKEGLIAEADANGQIIKSYGYVPGSTFTTNPLWQKSGTAYYIYQNDHLGTPIKLLSQSGAVVWSATYDAFGKATVDAGSSISNNLRFPGQYFDSETGLHYNWNRYYDPQIGRYITSDPIGLNGSINIYQYAEANPIGFTDPQGLNAGTIIGGEIGTIILPGPGTIIGAVIGTAIGAGIGWWIINSQSDDSDDSDDPDGLCPPSKGEEKPLKNRERRNKERREKPKNKEEREERQRENEENKRLSGRGGRDPAPTGDDW